MTVYFKQRWEEGRPEVDYDAFTLNEMPLYGIERVAGVESTIPGGLRNKTPFMCFDDDGSLTHTGTLDNDADGDNQSAALRWAETDCGATRILVLNEDEWEQEIG